MSSYSKVQVFGRTAHQCLKIEGVALLLERPVYVLGVQMVVLELIEHTGHIGCWTNGSVFSF